MPVQQAKVTVTSAGTRVPLAVQSTKCAWINIQAAPGNSGNVYVGTNLVSVSAFGVTLPNGDGFFCPPLTGENAYDLSQIEVDADNSGAVLNILYFLL